MLRPLTHRWTLRALAVATKTVKRLAAPLLLALAVGSATAAVAADRAALGLDIPILHVAQIGNVLPQRTGPPVRVEVGCPVIPASPVGAAFVLANGTPDGCLQARIAFRDCAGCPEMVRITAGAFTMGGPDNEPGRDDDEIPLHRVAIARDYAVGRVEITRGQFAAFVSDSGTTVRTQCAVFQSEWKNSNTNSWRDPGYPQTDAHPVTCVSWDDANAYVSWLSRKTGKQYRLLSEAEWEFAARAGTTSPNWWGDSDKQTCVNANGMDSFGKQNIAGVTWDVVGCNDGFAFTAPVATFTANAFGLYDMGGNAGEWVEDCYNATYDGAPTDARPWMTPNCEQHALRGGSWFNSPQFMRSAYRTGGGPAHHGSDYGFRIARTLNY